MYSLNWHVNQKRKGLPTLDEFDKLLLKAIDETLQYSLGDINSQIIYEYLEKKHCPVPEIPQKLDAFSTELRYLLGSGRGQILGSAAILEKAIAKVLCFKLGMEFNEIGPILFVDYVRSLKEVYNDGANKDR
jgi:hypothetical protein